MSFGWWYSITSFSWTTCLFASSQSYHHKPFGYAFRGCRNCDITLCYVIRRMRRRVVDTKWWAHFEDSCTQGPVILCACMLHLQHDGIINRYFVCCYMWLSAPMRSVRWTCNQVDHWQPAAIGQQKQSTSVLIDMYLKDSGAPATRSFATFVRFFGERWMTLWLLKAP